MNPLGMLVSVTDRDDANRLMRALGRDEAPDPGRTFSLPMSPTAAPVATHYGASTWDDDLLQILQSGVLPAVDWAAYGLDQTRAQAALDAIRYRSSPERPADNFAALEARDGTRRIPEDSMT